MAEARPPIVLASASPQRRSLLRSMGLRFRVVPSGVGEGFRGRDWRRMARALALRKARQVARSHRGALVVGSDTIVVCKGRLLLKPKDRRDALRILSVLNGSWQRVYTGVAVVCRDRDVERAGVEVSRVKARRLPLERLEQLAGKHLDKAGAYAVQDKGDEFIEKVEGPLDNVIGFPRALFRKLCRDAGMRLALACALGAPVASVRAEPLAPPAAEPTDSRETLERVERLKPILERMGLEVRGAAIRWPGGSDLPEPRRGAYLDEIEYLALLREARTGTANHLRDADRHKIGVRFFAEEFAKLGIRGVEEGGVTGLEGPGGRLWKGALDGYLSTVDRERRGSRAVPTFRALELAIHDEGAWFPAELRAKRGEHVALTLASRRAASGPAAGFRLEGWVEEREVPPLGGTVAGFLADRAGMFAFYDPGARERGEGALHVEGEGP